MTLSIVTSEHHSPDTRPPVGELSTLQLSSMFSLNSQETPGRTFTSGVGGATAGVRLQGAPRRRHGPLWVLPPRTALLTAAGMHFCP